MTIKPLADKVVVKVEEAEQTTASGIVLSTSAQEKPAFATVVAVGPGGVVDGEKVEMTVKVGDKVVTSKYSGTEIKLDGEEYTVSGGFEGDGKTILLYGGQGQEYAAIELSGLTDDIAEAADALEASLVAYHKIGDVTEAACFIRDEVLPKMDALRAPADEAERFTAAEYWPFPTYGDLLFGVK